MLLLFPLACVAAPRSATPSDTGAFVLAGSCVQRQGNFFTSSAQANAALSIAADDRIALVWDSKRQESGTFGVYARVFDSAGQALSHEFHVNTFLPLAQWHPVTEFATDNTLWFAWESHGQDGSGAAIVARPFSPDGQPLGGEVAVNQNREGNQCEVALAPGGGSKLLAVWSSHVPDLKNQQANGIRARVLKIDGGMGPEIVLSTPHGAMDQRPSITALTGGGFFVLWTRTLPQEKHSLIMGRFLDSRGQVLGSAFALLDDPTHEQVEAVVSGDADGQIVVAWMRSADHGYDVFTQCFNAQAAPLGVAIEVATALSGWKSGVAISATRDGSFAVAYNQETSLQPSQQQSQRRWKRQVLCHRFRSDGTLLESQALELSANGQLAFSNAAKRFLWTSDQRLVAAFQGLGAQGDPSAANLALWLPDSFRIPPAAKLAPKAPANKNGPQRHAANPPIWDPHWVSQPRLPLGTAAAGGDFGFEGVPGTGWTPPDPEMAVGDADILVMTNGEITSLTKTGVVRWTDLIEGSTGFWSAQNAGGFVFDPECCWDPHANRFLAVAAERTAGRSYFLFAISKSSSPSDSNDWWKYRFDVTNLAGNDIDSPNMAVGPNGVLLTADFFNPDAYLIYILDKASILSGGAPIVVSELITGIGQQSMGVPVVYDTDPNFYILQSTEFSSNNTVLLHAIEHPFSAYLRTTFTLPVPTYSYPAPPPQKGSSSRPMLFEPRFWSVAQRNGSLWAVHHVNITRTRVRWYEIQLNQWPHGGVPSLQQHGEIDLGDGIYTFFPSIHVDALNNVAITFSRSAANEYISIGRATRAATDAPNTFRPAQVVQTSNAAHTSGRWGDYSATQAEPGVPGQFWGHHEFTLTGTWRTWVARYILRPNLFLLAPVSLQSGANNTLSVSGATPGARVFFAYSLTGTALFEAPGINTILSLESPTVAGSASADIQGNAALSRFIPGSFGGTNVWLQAAESGHASNWIMQTVL